MPMSRKGQYSNPYTSASGNDQFQDDHSLGDSERSEPPVWESAVDSRGELFYAELEGLPPTPAGSRTEPGEVRAPSPPAAALPPPASAAGKLRHLLRRRRSQKAPRAELSVVSAPPPSDATGPGNDTTGEVYRVVVRLSSAGPSSGRPVPLCETMLGLICQHQLSPADAAASTGSQPVTVAALTPRGPLVRNPHVRIGDCLQRVNGVPVSATSLQSVLDALPRPGKARLSFRRVKLESDPAPGDGTPLTNGTSQQPACDGGLVTSLTGDGLRLEELGRLLRGIPYGLLCLSTEGLTETSPDRQDIVYQFPGYDTALLTARGSLLTISGLTKQISGDTPLRASVLVGSASVHVAITCQEELVLLLAAPETSLSAAELNQLGLELWQLLRLEFGSLHGAFGDASRRAYVDHLLGLVFQQALLTPELTAGRTGVIAQRVPASVDRLLAAAHAMHLPRHVQVLVDDSLTELESGDFGEESEDFYGLQRLFMFRGSALYYKGYLVASHLPPEDQAAVHLLLRHRQLLERTRRSRWRQLVVWRRYHRPKTAGSGAPAAPLAKTGAAAGVGVGSGTDADCEAYESDSFDHYLLVVGAKHALLAVLLESGGGTVQMSGEAGPDSIYVEEAQATLFQLESMGIMDMCESWLGGSPSLSSTSEEELTGGARLFEGSARESLLETRWWSRLVVGRRTNSRRSGGSHDLPPLRKDGEMNSATSVEDGGGGGRAGAVPPEDSRGGGGGGATWRRDTPDSPISAGNNSADTPRQDSCSLSEDGDSSTDGSAADTWEIYRGPPKSRLLPNQYDLMENKKIYISQALDDSRRVVADSFSLALQHVWLDVPAATYLALPEPLLTDWLRPELLAAFSRTVARLLPLLTSSATQTDGFPGTLAAGTPREVGTLFVLDGDGSQTFWVVGRQMQTPRRRQLFVCVPGCTPPDMLELAFRLTHGTGPW